MGEPHLLSRRELKHSVLNARQDKDEAEIVARAGQYGAIPVATNMAGRGTDIVLGGNLEVQLKEIDEDRQDAPIDGIDRPAQAAELGLLLAVGGVTGRGGGIAGATISTAQAYIADSTSLENRPKGASEDPHGVLAREKLVSLADLFDDPGRGRKTADQITYSERGNLQGAQFWAVASIVYEAAKKAGLGRELPTEWFVQDIRN